MKTLLIVLGFMVCLPAAAMAQEQEDLMAMCVGELSKQNDLQIDVQQYCGCLSKRLSHHEGKLEHMDGERVRKQVANDLKPCFDEYMQPPIMTLCADMNVKLKAEGEKLKMDCGCYYNHMLDTFSTAWAANLANEAITPEQQTAFAQQGVMACAKETP